MTIHDSQGRPLENAVVSVMVRGTRERAGADATAEMAQRERGCNIHDKMVGYIHVVDTPYFARTGANGSATLDLPPGEHRLRAWHPVLQATGTPVQDTVKLPAGASAALTIRLPGG